MLKRCAKLSISLAFLALTRLADQLAGLFGRPKEARCVILYYHAIPASHRGRFARQMDALLRWTRPIRADNTEPLRPGQNYAAVTFDDGFHSVAVNALPELGQRSIPATMFIVSGCLGRSPAWLSEEYLGNLAETTVTPEQLRALPSPLVTLGSHTVSHPRLDRIPLGEARKEIEDSRQQLEALGCGTITLFSFPHGAFNSDLVRVCREAGYGRVFTTEPVFAFSEPQEFVTGRVSANLTDWSLEFWLKLLGGYRWQATFSALKHKVRSARLQPEPKKLPEGLENG